MAKIETEAIETFLKNNIILVTGAAGSIGSEISRQVIRFHPRKLVILDFNESGIYDLEKELHMLSLSSNYFSWGLISKLNIKMQFLLL